MLTNTPIWERSPTDLGEAYNAFESRYAGNKAFHLGQVEPDWLNAVRNRATMSNDAVLQNATDGMLAMLTDLSPNPGGFIDTFMPLYNSALQQAYPLRQKLNAERHEFLEVADDYTLQCIDAGLIRAIEDKAVNDTSMRTFVGGMLKELNAPGTRARHQVYRQIFDIYSEALVCHLLKERCQGQLEIVKIPESSKAGPDFECKLRTTWNGEPKVLHFYIEVKALDIVAAPQRTPEMLDDSMDLKIKLEKQKAEGKRVAMATGEIAPHKPFGNARIYDPHSVRQVIETIIDKCGNNFKSKQFQRGPTFALANILRVPLHSQGASTLAPFFYDDLQGGACVSGQLWNVAFGERDAPIHRWQEFEGKGTLDGKLQRVGILIDDTLGLPAAGFIALHWDRGAYYFDGLYDPYWLNRDFGWSNIQVEQVMCALCGDYNDKTNSHAHKYAFHRPRERAS